MSIVRQPIRFGTFNGLNKKKDMLGLSYLKEAVNIDFVGPKDSTRIRRRAGHKTIIPGAASSLWSDGETCLFVQNGVLKMLHDDFSTTTDITAVDGEVCYWSAAGKIFLSDGVSSWVMEAGSVRRWGLERPPTPSVSLTHGEMPSGRYIIAITHVSADGRESGASDYAIVDGGGGISITGIQQPASGFVRVYASPMNGDVLYRVAELRNGETSTTFYGETSGIPLRTRFLEPAPPGHLVCYFKGRTFVAQENIIWYSEAFAPEHFDISSGFIVMKNRVTMMMPVQDGLYVADGSIKFLAGANPKEFVVHELADYDAIEGSAVLADAHYFNAKGDAVVFSTPEGICVGLNGGMFSNLTQDDVAFVHGLKGVGHIRHADGLVQYITLINGDAGMPVNNYTPNVGQIEIR